MKKRIMPNYCPMCGSTRIERRLAIIIEELPLSGHVRLRRRYFRCCDCDIRFYFSFVHLEEFEKVKEIREG